MTDPVQYRMGGWSKTRDYIGASKVREVRLRVDGDWDRAVEEKAVLRDADASRSVPLCHCLEAMYLVSCILVRPFSAHHFESPCSLSDCPELSGK